jgi:hypothetical protein
LAKIGACRATAPSADLFYDLRFRSQLALHSDCEAEATISVGFATECQNSRKPPVRKIDQNHQMLPESYV